MDNDSIDASLGLTFSLTVFRQYRAHGILQAVVRRVPGVRGSGVAYLQLKDGAVVSCHVEDRRGQHVSLLPEVLCRVDDEVGPFEWTFHPQEEQTVSTETYGGTPSIPSSYEFPVLFEETAAATAPQAPFQGQTFRPNQPMRDDAVPVIINVLALERLEDWTLQQKQEFLAILHAIDGRRSIYEIKLAVPLSSTIVDESLRLLLSWNTIAFSF